MKAFFFSVQYTENLALFLLLSVSDFTPLMTVDCLQCLLYLLQVTLLLPQRKHTVYTHRPVFCLCQTSLTQWWCFKIEDPDAQRFLTRRPQTDITPLQLYGGHQNEGTKISTHTNV